MTKRVVSVRLFGDAAMQSRYQVYFPAAIRAHHNLFRGWSYRIYHDHRVDLGQYVSALKKLHAAGLVDMRYVSDDVQIEKAMLWCLLPLWDDDVELFVIRDVDMVACYRERRAEEEWIRSGLAFHSISDRKGHHDWPTLNGMLGFRVSECRGLLDVGPGQQADEIEKLFARAPWTYEQWSSNYRASGPGGADPRHRVSKSTTNNQFFLAEYVWPSVKASACEHRLHGSQVYDGVKLSCTEVNAFDGETLGVVDEVRAKSDSLIPFIGASMMNSDINLDKIVEFYRQHGDSDVERAISSAES